MRNDRHKERVPELWGGMECTLNRVGKHFHSQLALNGHLNRPGDLELFAGLGIRTLRYPVLWEMVAPQSLDAPDWRWTDQRLNRLRELGLEPVAGLLHHGSGPSYTSLIDPDFPALLARYARLVARRYPWIRYFTPVNEPLTTARFSGLYGHWYPHGTDDRTFVRTLLSQCGGIVEAMRAIREVTPEAKLVMAEDMGKTFSTDLLRYQADYENHRRWLSLDLLAGKVDRCHPLRLWLEQNGVDEEEFDYFLQSGMAPDVVGLNYYLTSDRFLDHRLERYPEWTHGGNHQHRYADVEAVRACPEGILGHEEVLRSAWQRYAKEVALTEVHLGSTREEQLRWFHEAWQAGVRLCREGVPVRAVTAWSLLGSFDWCGLFTSITGSYEPGVFDIRGPSPRPTLLAGGLRQIVREGELSHPTVRGPGWWRRPDRFLPGLNPDLPSPGDEGEEERGGILIVGKTGTLGQSFFRLCRQRGIPCHLLSRSEIDIASAASVATALNHYEPWAVVNGAGFVRIDDAEGNASTCFRENTLGPAVLAAECARRGVPLMTFSSDMVFNGSKRTAYQERDPVSPINIYGQSKAEAERQVLQLYPEALVLRTSAFFGPWDRYNFVTATLRRLAAGETVEAAFDLVVSPTYIPDLVHAGLDLLLDGESGIWHLSNAGAVSWAELARCSAKMAGLDSSRVIPRPAASLGYLAPRPPFSVLGSERGVVLPELENALSRYFCDTVPPENK